MKTVLFCINFCAMFIPILFVNYSCKPKQKVTTGWTYNDEKNQGFETKKQGKPRVNISSNPYFKGMRLVPGGTFIMGRTASIDPSDKDSTLMKTSVPRRVTVASFYISDHEVTNKEYREFVMWMFQLSPDLPIEIYYPDTLCLVRDFPYSHNSLGLNYFLNPAFDNYPVVGVSWKQAMKYCEWRTERMNELIYKEKGTTDDFYPAFRLPAEAEWEFAAIGQKTDNEKESIARIKLFPWEGFKLTDKKGNYLANFGQIIDKNGFHIKAFSEKEGEKAYYFYTAPVKSFKSNDFKLFDMAGNVSEWTYDVPTIIVWEPIPEQSRYFPQTDSSEYQTDTSWMYKVVANDDMNSAISKIIKRKKDFGIDKRYDTTIRQNLEYLKSEALNEIHDAQLIARYKQARVVKGGSWANGPAYMICGRREAYPENRGSSRIGFRVAMIKPGEP